MSAWASFRSAEPQAAFQPPSTGSTTPLTLLASSEAWLEGGAEPGVVAGFEFEHERLRDVTSRQRALYQSTIALLMRRSPKDFHDGTPLTREIIDGRAVDDHHIFPRAWLSANGFGDLADTVLNHTLIGKIANIVRPGTFEVPRRDA